MEKLLKILSWVYTFGLLFFGGLSLFLTLSIYFDLFNIREKEGNYVWFVVLANFICSLLYLLSAILVWVKPKIAFYLLLGSVFVLSIGFISLIFHIQSGGMYEEKTMKAMIFRLSFSVLWTTLAFVIHKINPKIN